MSKQRTYRLSAQQRHIWHHQRRQGRILVARCQLAIAGPVESRRLLAAVQRTAQAHEVFRTSFNGSDEESVVQSVEQFAAVETWEQDWTELSHEEQQERMLEAWAGERKGVWHLERGPRLRAGLVRISDSHCELLLTTPSLCADAESLMRFALEIQEHDSVLQSQNHAERSPQYSQYAEWQHTLGSESAASGPREYWRRIQRRHESAAKPLAWELNDNRPDGLGSAVIEIDDSIVTRLHAVAEAAGGTVETLLLACWQVLLWRLNDRKPVPLCAWLGGRDSEELKHIQGPLGRYVPLTADLCEGTELSVLVENLRELERAARELQEYWPEGLLWNVPRFTYQELPPEWTTDFGRCRVCRADVEVEPSRLDLKCVMIPEKGRLKLRTELEYEHPGCDDATLQRIPARWRQLLLSAAEGAQKAIECLQIVDGLESRQLLQDYQLLASGHSGPACVHELFEEQVRRSPQAPAVVMAGERLSYAELNGKANQLARFLRKKGVGPEVVVGIALGRSLQMVQAVLGVLKAGGAYLPLEPGYPVERLCYMLRDSGATAVVAQTDVLEKLAEVADGVQWICPEPESHLIEEESPANLDVPVAPQNLAYLIYTSGSTGRPKGTLIPHGAVVNYLKWGIEFYGAARESLLHSSLGFDLTVTSLFLPLLSGGSVSLVKAQEGAEIQNLAQALSASSEPLLLKITPAHANLLGQVAKPEKLGSEISVMVVGGEALHPSDVAWCKDRWPHIRIFNEYGPTETVVGCCVHEMAWERNQPGTVPIGRPIRNTRIYVMDQELQLAPIATQGEIYVSGEGVGRGYCKRPELTAERFLPDPYAGMPGERMYRTGDLGRWRDSGVLECLGRNDYQVKLGGYRIELGEIEAVLREMNVCDAAVVKRQEAGTDCLVAYVAPREKVSLDVRAVESHLAAKLPRYMVPKLIVFLDRMPYTANGKLDRQALPDPWQACVRKPFVAPRTDLEELLAGIWTEVLERRPVGVEDGFFDLGGHSMSAVRIAARIQSALGVEITAQRLFEAGNVAGLSLVVEGELRKGSGIEPWLPQPIAGNGPLPLAYAQQRLWFFDQLSPASTTFNLVQALHIAGALRLDVMQRACNEIVRRHAVLRTSFPAVRGEAQQLIAPFRPFELGFVDLSLLPDPRNHSERLIRQEEQKPFDLARGPLHRISVYRLAPEEHIVVFSVHHIIFDGWSTSVFFREFNALYAAFDAGQGSPLPDLPIQYADFAFWENTAIRGQRLQKHVDFWRRELKEPLPVLSLPLDHERPAVQSFRGAKHDFALSPELTEALKKLAYRCGATLFMTLLGAFDILLYAHSGQTDIVVGTDVANRPGAAGEALIGFFVNQVPLRIGLDGNPEFTVLLARVREKALSTYSHQEMPFDRLVDALRVPRRSSSAPVFQVKLVLENIPAAEFDLPRLKVTPLAFTHVSAKLDLTLLLRESPGYVGGWFEYNSELFAAETIRVMAENLETLLSAVVEEPSIRLDDLVRRLGNLGTSAKRSTAVALGE
jgi:amino acid adenylation domain-containing protein